jgi:hypothetical protein
MQTLRSFSLLDISVSFLVTRYDLPTMALFVPVIASTYKADDVKKAEFNLCNAKLIKPLYDQPSFTIFVKTIT